MTGRGSNISGQGITSNLLLHFPHCQRTFGHEWAMFAANYHHRVVAYGFVFCRFFAVAAKLALPRTRRRSFVFCRFCANSFVFCGFCANGFVFCRFFAVAATLAQRRTRRQDSPDRTPT